MQKLISEIGGDAAFVKACRKGDGKALRESLSGRKVLMKPADFLAFSKWVAAGKVGDSACASLARELVLRSALSNAVLPNHSPAFEAFFDAASSKGGMESASRALSANIGRTQAIAGLRALSSKPIAVASRSAARPVAVVALEASKLCTQAAAGLRRL